VLATFLGGDLALGGVD